MMAARKQKPLHVVQSEERQNEPDRKGLPTVKVYFPNRVRLKECQDLVEAEYQAGRLQSPSVSAFFYSQFCRYVRERAENDR